MKKKAIDMQNHGYKLMYSVNVFVFGGKGLQYKRLLNSSPLITFLPIFALFPVLEEVGRQGQSQYS
jgi:hypothetical protein